MERSVGALNNALYGENVMAPVATTDTTSSEPVPLNRASNSSENIKHKVKGMGDFRTVGEMRKSMKLDQYDDSFERGLYDDGSVDDMGRTCHYCSGQGCAQCNMTGHL